jgi:glycerol-3-phosphate dehydrogenase
MRRDLAALADRPWDVAVVGGGIYGICAVREAVRRGFTACLIERGDFVGATSSNSLKVLHGGLRYLQHADLGRMRESIRERRLMLRLAPHLVRPLPFVLPTQGHGLRGREVMRVALALNDLIGLDRSAGALPSHRIPRGRVMGRERVRSLVPGLTVPGLTGAAVWFDCQVADTERLAFAFLHSADAAGAACANYVEAVRLLHGGGAVRGVEARDRLGGEQFEVRARTVVNTTGPWLDRLPPVAPETARPRRFHHSKALNLVTRQLLPACAVGFSVPAAFTDSDALIDKGSRVFFVVPWKQFSLIGTRHLPYRGGPDEFRVTEEDVVAFLAEINLAWPGAGLDRGDVLAVLGGMLPEVPRAPTGEVQLLKHSQVFDHAADGAPGLFSTLGVKWTTSRRAAELALDLVESRLRPGRGASRPPETWLPGGEMDDVERFIGAGMAARPEGVAPDSMRHLLQTYGTDTPEVLARVRQRPGLAQAVGPRSPVIGAEVLHGIEREMAQHLEDVVLRRTALAAGGHPGRAALLRCAELMGEALCWTADRRFLELERTEQALGRMFASDRSQEDT